MRKRAAFLLAMFLVAAGALAFRLPDLGIRPFHGDEAVHAFKFLDVWKHGVYRYDPNEFHGPTLYYAALPSIRLHGRHALADCRESDFRLPIAIFGAGMALIIAPLSSGLGRRAVLAAAVLTAISPALVFYSRYYIQETLLAFFTLAMIAFAWQYTRNKRAIWLLLSSAAAGLMIATKETSVLAFAAMAIGLLLTVYWTRLVDRHALRLRGVCSGGLAVAAALLAVFVAALFLSGFGSNRSGPLGVLTGPVDYLLAFTPWLRRAGGASVHIYPWHYYFDILLWSREGRGPVYSEAVIVALAAIGSVTVMLPERVGAFQQSRPLARFVVFYTLVLAALYSAIPYKTPWCIVSALNGMILLAGVGAVALYDRARRAPVRILVALLLCAGCLQLGLQAYRSSFKAFTDPRNPYVYSQPDPDVTNLGQWVWGVAHYSGEGEAMVIKVIWPDDYYWPLPWYLREFGSIGYYHEPSAPEAPLVLATPEFEEALTGKIDKTHIMAKYFEIRPGVFAQAWVRLDVWQKYLKARPRPKDDE